MLRDEDAFHAYRNATVTASDAVISLQFIVGVTNIIYIYKIYNYVQSFFSLKEKSTLEVNKATEIYKKKIRKDVTRWNGSEKTETSLNKCNLKYFIKGK